MSIDLENVRVCYAGSPVIKTITVSVEKGQILGLRGRSGSGKTTIMRAIAGQLPVNARVSGRYELDGELVFDAPGEKPIQFSTPLRSVAMIEQNSMLAVDPHMTLRDMIAQPLRANRHRLVGDVGEGSQRGNRESRRRIGGSNPGSQPKHDASSMADAIAQACLRAGVGEELLDRLPHEVSGGQLQRACVARLLIARPSYVLADEPTAHLDPISTATIAGVLRELAEQGCGVIVASHEDALLEKLTE